MERREVCREGEVFEPGRRMRESELLLLLFQVILTQVTCTRQWGRREEGVKVYRLLRRATCGMAVVFVCVWERERNHLTCQVGNQVASRGGDAAQAAMARQARGRFCKAANQPASQAGRRVKMYVRKALHIFSLGRERTGSLSQIVALAT